MDKKIKKSNVDYDKRKKKIFVIGGVALTAALVTTAVLVTRYLTIKKYRSAVTLTFNANNGVFADTQLKTYKLEVEKTTHFKDIVNKVNQPKLSSYVFEGWKNGSKLVDDFIINDDMTLNASYVAPDPKSFATDSWSTIACIADQGLDKLKEVYEPNGGTFVITDEDDTEEKIAAKTRSVTFDTLGTFKVRVIGENHDYLSNTTDKVAALTFEFSEIINPAVPDKFREFDDYVTSSFRHYLQDDVYYSAPTDLRSNLRMVKKDVVSSRAVDIIVLDEYFFALSYAEIANSENYDLALIQEGSLYEYYQNPTHSIKKLYHEDPNLDFYRLRSLDDDRLTRLLSVVNENISNASSEELSGASGIAPGFCIGESSLTNVNSHRITWDNTTYNNNLEFTAALNTHLSTTGEVVKNGYIKYKAKSDDFVYPIRISSNTDLLINLVSEGYGEAATIPSDLLISQLENDGYTFITVDDKRLLIGSGDYEIHYYAYGYGRCEIKIPAEKITGDVKITLFSYANSQ